MIACDVLQWLVTTLRKEKDTLSVYSMEYGTALLMNLSLRRQGKLKLEKFMRETL